MKKNFILLLSLAPVLYPAMCLLAQSTNATMSGLVRDPAGKVLSDALIEVANTANGSRYTSKTNGEGIYSLSILPPGQYIVQVSKGGFKTLIKPGIVLNVQSALSLNFTLPVGAVSETVTVESGASLVNTVDGAVSTIIDRTFVENMPLNGRSFQTLLTLAPGVSQVGAFASGNSVGSSGDIVVNGQRTESNYYTVDGVSANTGSQPGLFGAGAGTSGSTPGLTAVGSTQSLVSVDSLQEFRSSTSTYSAEYGRTPGGNFSFSTRTGTNAFRGSLYDYFRNDALDANNWFNDFHGLPKTRERQNDFGGTFGGPIVFGHHASTPSTHFFTSYEGLRLRSPQPAIPVPVPTDALRAQAPAALQPALNAFPRENDGDSGLNNGFGFFLQSVSYPAQLDNWNVRLDRTLGSKVSLFGRFADSPSSTTTYAAAIEQTSSLYNRTATLGATLVLSSQQSNDLRFNFTQNGGTFSSRSTDVGGATPLVLSTLPGPTGSFPTDASRLIVTFTFASFTKLDIRTAPSDQKQINITDTHSWLLGRHSLKAGVDWRRLATVVEPVNPSEQIAFTAYTQVQTNKPASVLVKGDAPHTIEPVYLNFSTFLQDEWRISPKLSLSLGWRWDINPAPGDARGPRPYTVTQVDNLSTTKVAPQGTPLWGTDWIGHAPRIGAAYVVNPQARLTTVARAGFGLFYDLGTALAGNGYSGIGFLSQSSLPGASFPLTSQQLVIPAPSLQAPYTAPVFAFDPHLKLPYALHYSLAIEQSLSPRESLSVSYVGSGAHRLLTNFITYPQSLGNANFAVGDVLQIAQGRASSNYNSMQVKYQRNMSKGLQGLVSYTWSHSIDNASSNFIIYHLLRAPSDYDIRHNLQAAVTYQPDAWPLNSWAGKLANHWAFDLRLQARTALPVDVIGTQTTDSISGVVTQYQPNRVAGQPLYLYGAAYPGGRVINYNAFAYAAAGVQGNSPRNIARGFGTVELDPALRREFPLTDQFRLQFRAEAFNIANHPSFGSIYNYLAYGPLQFGQAYTTLNTAPGNLNSLYQVGGPRSLQLALKLLF
ncbi:Carboxypeptidase regulatory-like domain-containing protein [Granulicella rosea]|uniref:Carboxypeptidase regulatory-like domain-containing protein n=1 Tax=Granulicella rosea TaxID=474952 RepID=A0A239EAF7_9BACT|nr:TonB-dependent receptor [Granulicella rosea]SNS41268.1 Carboxypeptidase regulatory-like domain-containing protein [Granulicella rosea]